jgi:hypothetical protein
MTLPVAHAEIDLEWRPSEPTVIVGDIVRLGLYAVSDDETDQSIAAMDVLLAWEPEFLELLGKEDNGPYEWLFSGFPDDSGLDGLNDTWLDGDAFYSALARFGAPAFATPEGLLVTTMQFQALAETPGTELTIPEHLGEFSYTRVYDGEIPGKDVHGELGSATIIILSEVPGDCDADGDVDLDDLSTYFDCVTGPDGGPLDPECECADFDGDDDVDFADFAAFQLAFTGSAP